MKINIQKIVLGVAVSMLCASSYAVFAPLPEEDPVKVKKNVKFRIVPPPLRLTAETVFRTNDIPCPRRITDPQNKQAFRLEKGKCRIIEGKYANKDGSIIYGYHTEGTYKSRSKSKKSWYWTTISCSAIECAQGSFTPPPIVTPPPSNK